MRVWLYVMALAGALALALPLAQTAYPLTLTSGPITFNADEHLINPSQPSVLGVQALEPGIKVDTTGNIFINAIRGVPAGDDIWKTTTAQCQDAAQSVCPINYEGQPETLATTGTGPGGGDIDMATGLPYGGGGANSPNCTDAGSVPPNPGPCSGSAGGNLYMASLTLGNQTAITCKDANLSVSGCTPPNPVSNPQTDEDREWLAAEGAHTAYISYHIVGPQNISVCKSTNDGVTYPVCSKADVMPVGGTAANNQLGNLVVDQSGPTHYLYQIYASTATVQQNVDTCPLNAVWVAVSSDSAGAGTLGLTFTNHLVYAAPVNDLGPNGPCTGTSLNHIFPSIAVDKAGNVYAEWTDSHNVFYSSSIDHGTTWNGKTDGTGPPTQVSSPYGANETACTGAAPSSPGLHTTLFPWIDAGAPGHVDFVWYGSPSSVFDGINYGCPAQTSGSTVTRQGSPWNVYFAQTPNGTNFATPAAPNSGPLIYQTVANHNPNHYGAICTSGTTCTSGRTLGDFFQVAVEPQTQCAVIAYANDTNPALPTQAYFNRQTAGCILNLSSAGSTTRRAAPRVSPPAHLTVWNVYGVSAHGAQHRLNPAPIVQAAPIADLQAQITGYARGAHVRQFYLQRIAPNGNISRYGPYRTGQRYF